MENKRDRFRRVAEARVNKIIKMVRLLGNCSGRVTYQYDADQVEQIFSALQRELDSARRRFCFGKRKFSLKETYNLREKMLANPHVILLLPNGCVLTAVAFQQDDYPSINIYLSRQNEFPELICFAEYNPERSPCHEICIGTYQSDDDETKYYAPYWAERNHNGTKHDLPSEEAHLG